MAIGESFLSGNCFAKNILHEINGFATFFWGQFQHYTDTHRLNRFKSKGKWGKIFFQMTKTASKIETCTQTE
jgi:hypothetical protein